MNGLSHHPSLGLHGKSAMAVSRHSEFLGVSVKHGPVSFASDKPAPFPRTLNGQSISVGLEPWLIAAYLSSHRFTVGGPCCMGNELARDNGKFAQVSLLRLLDNALLGNRGVCHAGASVSVDDSP